MKGFFRYKPTRVWFIVTAVLLAFFMTVSILVSTTFYRAVCTFLGEERNAISGTGDQDFTSEFTTKEQVLTHANDVNRRIAEEGFVLLKNEQNILPLKTSESDKKTISVFGKNSVNLAYAGSGSAGGDSSKASTIYDSLTQSGYAYNEALKAFYEDPSRSGNGRGSNPKIESGDGIAGFSTGETPVDRYSGLESSYKNSDLALVVFTRIGGEGYDLPTTMKKSFTDGAPVDGAVSADDHYLELDQNEMDLLEMVCENFDKVVVVLNSSTPLEIGFLDAAEDGDATMNDYDYASHIQGAIWIGYPGNSGILALGKILNGTVNPSGRLVDTFAKDFSAIPSYNNVGLNGEKGTDSYATGSEHFSDYEEGIYIGYRYFETRYATEEDGDAWYEKNVAYPFGYGLSYTNFSWELKETKPSAGAAISADTAFSVTVKVTNEGDCAGKDVVQVYVTLPYTGKIEKSAKVLVGFAKTKLIDPGKSDEVTITFNSYDFASFDDLGKVESGYAGYLLERGNYEVLVAKNAHDAGIATQYEATETVKFQNGVNTDVVPLFSDADDQLRSVLSRSDWEGTWPKRRTDAEKNVPAGFEESVASLDSGNPLTAESEKIKNANLEYARAKRTSEIQLWQLKGKAYDDELWEGLIKNLTVSTMFDLCSNMGSFGTIGIEYIGKIKTLDEDGPNGFTNFLSDDVVFDTCMYASECVLAATWNVELANELGESIGYEGLLGNMKGTPYSGWYAPGVNLHRSPFGGRNSEYYSEDCVLSGNIAAGVIRGAYNKGVYCFMKHFAVNEQETHRAGVCTWLTEQSLRELYLKPFEIAVKKGNANAVMSSFNRIGTKWTGGDYRLLTTVLRDEWGFKGAVVTDFADKAYMDNKQMTYVGGDIRLSNLEGKRWVDTSHPDPVDLYVLKESSKNVLYVVANSNAMNGLGEGSSVKTLMPYWQIGLIVFDCVLAMALGVWGFFVVRKFVKSRKKQEL